MLVFISLVVLVSTSCSKPSSTTTSVQQTFPESAIRISAVLTPKSPQTLKVTFNPLVRGMRLYGENLPLAGLTSSRRLKPWDSWRARRANSTTDTPGSQEPGLMGFLLEVSSSPEVRSTGGPDAFTCAARPKPEACPMPWGMRDAETSGISIISDGYVGATPRASLMWNGLSNW